MGKRLTSFASELMRPVCGAILKVPELELQAGIRAMNNPLFPLTLQRIRAEYLEMPGLTLTPGQVQRLCGLDGAACEQAIRELVETGFLAVRADGAVARLKDAEQARLRPAKASLEPNIASVLARARLKAG
jgi:hypothetical protein